MSEVSVEQVSDAMYAMLKEYHGKRSLKAMDLSKAMIKKFGEDSGVDKKFCKKAIRQLIDSGRCIYSYVGGSFITLTPES